jgi:uncharacterized protein
MRIILLTLILAVAGIESLVAQTQCLYDQRSKINVTGEAVVNVTPDKIILNFGIETWDNDITIAKQKNNVILKKAIEAIKKCGVPDKEIQTDHLSIEPRWKDGYSREGFIGYFVRNAFIVTINETDKIENLVTTVLRAGITHIHGIDFQATEFKKYREQARELALQAAKEKAVKMASVLGKSIGDPIQINESFGGSPWWYYSSWSGWGYGRNSGMSQNVSQNAAGNSNDISETIALGKISIQANVNVTFELTE